MRVVILSWEYPPNVTGGLGTHVCELVPVLAQQGIEVHVVTPEWAGQTAVETVSVSPHPFYVHRVAMPPIDGGYFYHAVWQRNKLFQDYARGMWESGTRFDLIHAHDWLVSFAAIGLKQAHDIPLVTTIHATERGRNRGYLGSQLQHEINSAEWYLTYESDRIITCSESMSGEVRTFFNMPAEKITLIPNGLDMSRFRALDGVDLQAYRSQLALDHEKVVICVGRMVYEKGQQVLVEAIPRVLSQYYDAKFVIAGRGPMAERLLGRAYELGIQNKVLFPGFVTNEERDELYRLAACAVFPSLYEPFGIVALEAMGAGCPVVVSDVGGLGEVVEHGETGVTVYPDNVDSLTWGILHTLQHPDWAATRVENAIKIVETKYSWARIGEQTAALYRDVAAQAITQ